MGRVPLIAAQDAVAAMPVDGTFEEAAALPLAGTTALMCLSAGNVQGGNRLLINGASGGVGTRCSWPTRWGCTSPACAAPATPTRPAAGRRGGHRLRSRRLRAAPDRYDVVLDLVGNRKIRALRNLLRPTGTLVLSGGGVPGTGRYLGPIGLLVRAQLLARLPGPRIVIPQAQPTERLEELRRARGSGVLVSVIDRVFDLDDGADAVRYVETDTRGKVILAADLVDPRTSQPQMLGANRQKGPGHELSVHRPHPRRLSRLGRVSHAPLWSSGLGFIGRWLVKELLNQGVTTTAVVRSDTSATHLLGVARRA